VPEDVKNDYQRCKGALLDVLGLTVERVSRFSGMGMVEWGMMEWWNGGTVEWN
jgi:hypothetical protein